MIPKTIHYCWFGRNPRPELAEKCIASWKKFCPDYEIIEWNEDNFDLAACPLYVRQAYEVKRWAFVTDYVRLQVVYEHGGIYLDTDVELIKPFGDLLKHQAYFGFEDGNYVNTGLGFGAVQGHPILREMMDDYQDIPFIREDGTQDILTCPVRSTQVLLRRGLQQNNSKQILEGDVLILPKVYLCPLSYVSGEMTKSSETVSVHWFSASWKTAQEKAREERYRKYKWFYKILGMSIKVCRKLLGDEGYEKLRRLLKHKK